MEARRPRVHLSLAGLRRRRRDTALAHRRRREWGRFESEDLRDLRREVHLAKSLAAPGWRFARHTNDHRDALDELLGTPVIADPAEAVAVLEQGHQVRARRSGHRVNQLRAVALCPRLELRGRAFEV